MNPFPPLRGLLKLLLSLLGLIIALALLDAWIFYVHTPGWKPAFVSTSPDGRFTVSVYYNTGVLPLPPALHPRGRAGTIVLRENKTGKVLQRANSTYVHSSGEPVVTWYQKTNRVGAINVDIWDLPPEEPDK